MFANLCNELFNSVTPELSYRACIVFNVKSLNNPLEKFCLKTFLLHNK